MTVHLRRIDKLALIALDRPEVLNALNASLLHDLGAALDQVADSDSRLLLVTGAGDRAFCAGADIKELMGRLVDADLLGAGVSFAREMTGYSLPAPGLRPRRRASRFGNLAHRGTRDRS